MQKPTSIGVVVAPFRRLWLPLFPTIMTEVRWTYELFVGRDSLLPTDREKVTCANAFCAILPIFIFTDQFFVSSRNSYIQAASHRLSLPA